MKKLTVLLATILLSISAISQEETLLNGEIESGGYGAVFTKIGVINGKTGVFIGGQGAWIINHKLAIGGKGYGLVSSIDMPDMENIKLEFGSGGGLIEYTIASDNVVHANINMMIGAGSVGYSVKNYENDHNNINYTKDSFFVLEPGVDAEFNISKHFRIGLGVYYRIVSGVDYEDLTNADLNGLSGELTLKFGVF